MLLFLLICICFFYGFLTIWGMPTFFNAFLSSIFQVFLAAWLLHGFLYLDALRFLILVLVPPKALNTPQDITHLEGYFGNNL